MLLARNSSHRCNRGTQISAVTCRTVHEHTVADASRFTLRRARQPYLIINSKHHSSDAFQVVIQLLDIWYVIFQHSDVLQRLPVFSSIFFMQSLKSAEWRLERHDFIDACCSWISSVDELFLEGNVSATVCSGTVFAMSRLHLSVSHYHIHGNYFNYFQQQALLKFKDIWYVIFQNSEVLHTLPVFSYLSHTVTISNWMGTWKASR